MSNTPYADLCNELEVAHDKIDKLRAEVGRLRSERDSWKGSAIGNEDDLANALAGLTRVKALLSGDVVFDQQTITVSELRAALKGNS